MYRISPEALLSILEDLKNGIVRNVISVEEPEKHWSKVALERMLEITSQAR
jgi:quinolinate synthase